MKMDAWQCAKILLFRIALAYISSKISKKIAGTERFKYLTKSRFDEQIMLSKTKYLFEKIKVAAIEYLTAA